MKYMTQSNNRTLLLADGRLDIIVSSLFGRFTEFRRPYDGACLGGVLSGSNWRPNRVSMVQCPIRVA
jgi:hypothetical protein